MIFIFFFFKKKKKKKKKKKFREKFKILVFIRESYIYNI